MTDHVTKRCRKCGQDKPLDAFGRHAGHTDGRQSVCRDCKRATDRARWQTDLEANRAAHREVSRRHSDRNPEAVRESKARYREKNRDALRAKGREYWQDPEVKERARQRYEADRETRMAQMRRRYLDLAAALGAQVFGHYGTSCACCGRTDRLCIDHVNGDGKQHREELFGRQGGGVEFWDWLITQGFPDGYQTLCRACNASKSDGDRCRLTH